MRPYLRAANITWNGTSFDDIKEMNFDNTDFEKYRLKPGDILLNEASGSPSEVGKPVIWHGELDNACFQNTLLRLRPRQLDRDYLYWYCYYSALTGKFGEASRGVNIRHLGKRGLHRFPILVASPDEQQRIVVDIREKFQRVVSTEQLVQVLLNRIATLRRSFLTEAFAGRLVPQNPDDESVSVLLDSIIAVHSRKKQSRVKQ